MHLLYLTFGENINNHSQAQFSIFSFLTQAHKNLQITVVTDQPGFYSSIATSINIIPVDVERLKDWKGEYDFFWRIKIKAIQMVCEMHTGEAVVYLDSDTFLYTDIASFAAKLENGIAFMHEDEGALSRAKSKTERRMWSQVGNKTYGRIRITDKHSMWNAGVVATPNTRKGRELVDALLICDEMCKSGVTRRLIEQFALSVALGEHYELMAADKFIGHYWSNKEGWNEAINKVFIEAYCKGMSIEEVVRTIGSFDFGSIAIKTRVKNTRVRLESVLAKILPDRQPLFLPKKMEG